MLLSDALPCRWSRYFLELCLWNCRRCCSSSLREVGEPYQEAGDYVSAEEYAQLCGCHAQSVTVSGEHL